MSVRFNWLLSSATTSPAAASVRPSSHPTCPVLPMSRIFFTKIIRHHAATCRVGLFQKVTVAHLVASQLPTPGHSTKCSVRTAAHSNRWFYKEIPHSRTAPQNRAQSLWVSTPCVCLPQKVEWQHFCQNAASFCGYPLQHPAPLRRSPAPIFLAPVEFDNAGHAARFFLNANGCPAQSCRSRQSTR